METNSENTPKPKRGRPKSFARICADSSGSINANGTLRTKLNFQYAVTFLGLIIKAPEETQREIMGCTCADLHAGKYDGKYPPGLMTLGYEAGRFLESINATDEDKSNALKLVLNARRAGVSMHDIKAHFRKLRLGEREGSAYSLTLHLSRAFDEYMSRFPATTRQAQAAAVRNLLEVIEDRDE
jgi:hypothetical protein